MAKKVLVVDDDPSIVSLIEVILKKDSYEVIAAYNGVQAIEALDENDIDAAILDMMLPDINGLSLLKEIRGHEKSKHIPVMMVTGRDDEIDTVLGLEMGADDYIHKPFKKREFLARLNVIFRRIEQDKASVGSPIAFGNVILNPLTHELKKSGQEIILSPKEYKLLLLLVTNPNRVFSRDELLDKVWDDVVAFETRTVDVHIRRLRTKVEEDPQNPVWIETIRGYGYRFTN